MMKGIKRRFGALAVLAILAFAAPNASADMASCFDACYVMEQGCGSLSGTLVGSCSFNPAAPPNQQCMLPGCICEQNVGGRCSPGDDIPLPD